MGLLDLFAKIGTPIVATAATNKRDLKRTVKKCPESFPKNPPVPPKSTTWAPASLVLYSHRWQCRCGNCGQDTPIFMVYETHGKPSSKFYQTRFRAIGNPNAYPHLLTEVIVAEPSHIRACDICGPNHMRETQLSFPGAEFAQPAAIIYHKPPVEKLYAEYEAMRIEATSLRALM
jgi:hypothetical protein